MKCNNHLILSWIKSFSWLVFYSILNIHMKKSLRYNCWITLYIMMLLITHSELKCLWNLFKVLPIQVKNKISIQKCNFYCLVFTNWSPFFLSCFFIFSSRYLFSQIDKKYSIHYMQKKMMYCYKWAKKIPFKWKPCVKFLYIWFLRPIIIIEIPNQNVIRSSWDGSGIFIIFFV